jgi:RNA polymerase sigma-70 factor (ECF subfamily)
VQPDILELRPTQWRNLVDRDQDWVDVRRVLEGDLTAFENIVRRWQNPLINLAFRFCRDRQRAEDMAQDAFLQIYRKLNTFEGKAAFSTWIFAISLNIYRSTMRRKSFPVEYLDVLAEMASGQLPHIQMEQQEREELVRRAVTALPPRYRDAVIVFYFREKDLTETAAILGVPEGTAKAWLHRGREILRRKLDRGTALSETAQEVRL